MYIFSSARLGPIFNYVGYIAVVSFLRIPRDARTYVNRPNTTHFSSFPADDRFPFFTNVKWFFWHHDGVSHLGHVQLASCALIGATLSPILLAMVMLVCFACVPSVLRLCHQQPIMIVYVAQYFHALMWGVIPIMMQSCLEQFFYGVLKQRWVILTNTLSLLIGVPIIAYTLFFRKFGFPALGVGGLGLTFAIQAWFGFL